MSSVVIVSVIRRYFFDRKIVVPLWTFFDDDHEGDDDEDGKELPPFKWKMLVSLIDRKEDGGCGRTYVNPIFLSS